MKLRKYTVEKLSEAVKNSTSLAQVLRTLGIAPCGGNYIVLKKAINHFSLDASHFTGRVWNKGKSFGPKQPLERYLNNEIQILSFKLKTRLLSEGIFHPKCSSCQRKTWLGKPIPLELGHINGNHLDNQLHNLRLLCPNCHALTPTYRGKNRPPNLARCCHFKGFTEFDSIHAGVSILRAQITKSVAYTISPPRHADEKIPRLALAQQIFALREMQC